MVSSLKVHIVTPSFTSSRQEEFLYWLNRTLPATLPITLGLIYLLNLCYLTFIIWCLIRFRTFITVFFSFSRQVPGSIPARSNYLLALSSLGVFWVGGIKMDCFKNAIHVHSLLSSMLEVVLSLDRSTNLTFLGCTI